MRHSPLDMALFPILIEIAYRYGYVMTVSDLGNASFDLVAFPWEEHAEPQEALVNALIARYRLVFGDDTVHYTGPSGHYHGRHSWCFQIDHVSEFMVHVYPTAARLPNC